MCVSLVCISCVYIADTDSDHSSAEAESPKKKTKVADGGSPKKKKKKYTAVCFPYGPAARCTKEGFKTTPYTYFATTLAAMYPFLAVPKSEWEDVIKQCAHPMTSLWPVQTVKRHMHFVRLCKYNLRFVFETYEAGGGDYYGTEETSSSPEEDETSSEEDGDGSQNVVARVDDVF